MSQEPVFVSPPTGNSGARRSGAGGQSSRTTGTPTTWSRDASSCTSPSLLRARCSPAPLCSRLGVVKNLSGTESYRSRA